MTLIKWALTVAVVASLSGCIIPPSDKNYDEGSRSGHHHKHSHNNHHAADYENANGVHMITRDGVTLPDCEAVGGSQADNGSTCFYR